MIRLTRLSPRQTRFGLFTNLTDLADMRTFQVWYLDLYCWPIYFSIGGKVWS